MRKLILSVFLFFCTNFLWGQDRVRRIREIDSNVRRIDSDTLVALFIDKGQKAAFYKDGEIVKVRNSVLHVGVKTFDYYFLKDKVIMLHITHRIDSNNLLVDTYYLLDKKKIISKRVLGTDLWRNDEWSSKYVIEQANHIRTTFARQD